MVTTVCYLLRFVLEHIWTLQFDVYFQRIRRWPEVDGAVLNYCEVMFALALGFGLAQSFAQGKG